MTSILRRSFDSFPTMRQGFGKITMALIFFLSTGWKLSAQDLVVFADSTEIQAIVKEVAPSYVRYLKYDNPQGPVYTVGTNALLKIIYQNGTEDRFDGSVDTNQPSLPASSDPIYYPSPALYKGVIRFQPLPTIISAAFHVVSIPLNFSWYYHPKIALPVDMTLFFAPWVSENWGMELMTGIEAVPLTHREKSGLYLDLKGGVFLYGNFLFTAVAHIGYQLITPKGFALTVAGGARYTAPDSFDPHLMLGLGFAF